MKLELKHLTPYLPYKLGFMLSDIGIFNIDSEYQKPSEAYEKLKLTNILISDRIEVELEHENGWSIGFIELEEIKPILRPLSDLEEFSPAIYNYLVKNCENYVVRLQQIDYNVLIENHFDVFKLIENGLAIDINSLPQSSE